MPKKSKFIFLCTGDKKHKSCINARITITEGKKPLWASSMNAETVKSLTVFCRAKDCFIREVVTHCEFFANIELQDYLINKRLCEFT